MLGESGRQTVQRLLFPEGDVSNLLPADLWLGELLTSDLTQSGEDDLSNLQGCTHIVITETESQERKNLLQ